MPAKHAPCLGARDLPPLDAWLLIFEHLSPEDRKNAALACRTFAAAAHASWRTVIVSTSLPTRHAGVDRAVRATVEEIVVVSCVEDVDHLVSIRKSESDEGRLGWRLDGGPPSPGPFPGWRHLSALGANLARPGGVTPAQGRKLALLLPGRLISALAVEAALHEERPGSAFSRPAHLVQQAVPADGHDHRRSAAGRCCRCRRPAGQINGVASSLCQPDFPL